MTATPLSPVQRRNRTRLGAAAFVVLALIGLGCSGAGNDDSGPSNDGPVASSDGRSGLPRCSSSRPKDCYDEKHMQQYTARSFDAVWGTFKEELVPDLKLFDKPKLVWVATNAKVDSGCLWKPGSKETYVDSKNAYTYCPNDHIVYAGQSRAWTFYKVSKYMGAIVLAHETGHHLQDRANIPKLVVLPGQKVEADDEQLILDTEDQADCIAGAYAKAADISKAEGVKVFTYIQTLNKTRKYKTKNERVDAFVRGYDHGLSTKDPASCSSHYFKGRDLQTA